MFGVGAFSTCTRFEEPAQSESEPSGSSDEDEPRTATRPRFEELSFGASGLRTTRHTALGRREQREHESGLARLTGMDFDAESAARALRRARGDVEFAVNASAVEHSRDAGARLDATLADLRGLAAARTKVLTVVVERESHGERALTVPSTFAMLAAAWGGRVYHELHVDARHACECRAPAIQRAREPHKWGEWTSCGSRSARGGRG